MKSVSSKAAALLRANAEARLKKRKSASGGLRQNYEMARLVHELQVHQIELEMQNEELQRAKEEVESLLSRYTELYEFAPAGYLTLGPDGNIRQINVTGCQLLGIERSRVLDRRLTAMVSAPHRATFNSFLKRVFGSRTKLSCEVPLSVEAQRILYVRLEASKTHAAKECRVVMIDITDRKQADDEIQRLNVELETRVRQRTATIRRLAIELTLAEKRERIRISHVLHEHLQQLMYGAMFFLKILPKKLSQEERQRIARVNQILTESVHVTRTLASELSPPILRDEGLGNVLKWLAQSMRENHGLAVNVHVGRNGISLPEELAVILYQSVRELLFNVLKHAKVKSARVTLDMAEGQVTIVVSDKGAGFVPSRPTPLGLSPQKFGLFSVRERLALLDGELKIESAPGKGSRIELQVPMGKG